MSSKEYIFYKIVCIDPNISDIYVGQTNNFTKRKEQHEKACNHIKTSHYKVYKTIRENGNWSNWTIVEIENGYYDNKYGVLLRERYWIEQLNATLNTNIPTRTQKERNDDNREKQKEWTVVNKDRLKRMRLTRLYGT